jgi:hypothetical protein
MAASVDIATVLDELRALGEECRDADWDGFGALAVNETTLRNACRFVESLPAELPMPDVGAEPDGAVTLEWHRNPRLTLSVSVHEDGSLHYAALIGAGRHWGTEPFEGAVSSRLSDLIHEASSNA